MPAQERRIVRAGQVARRDLVAVGEDIREARLRSGMTLRELSGITGTSIAELSRIERALSPHVAHDSLARIGSAVGLDVRVRAFPNGQPVRDAAQLALLGRLRLMLPAGVRLRLEVPLGIPGDLRAWDAAMEAPSWWRPVEAESRLRDVQALQRRIRLKVRDSGVQSVILVVAATRHNRQVLRTNAEDLADLFPTRSPDLLRAIRAGIEPARGGILVL